MIDSLRTVDHWFFRPAPASRPAVLRILTGSYAVSYLLARFPVFFTMADSSAAVWEPVGALWWMRPVVLRIVPGTCLRSHLPTPGALPAGGRP